MQARDVKSEDAADDCVWNARERKKRVAEVVKQTVKRPRNQHKADRHDDLQSLLCFLEITELTGPDQMVAGGKFHVVRDSLLSVLNSAAKVAATNAELHRDKALHAFVINPRRARIEADGGQFT